MLHLQNRKISVVQDDELWKYVYNAPTYDLNYNLLPYVIDTVLNNYRTCNALGIRRTVPETHEIKESLAKKLRVQFLLTTNLTHFFNVFISPLYVFRATYCSSSGESIVSIHHLVYITLCRWPSGMPVRQEPAYQTAIYTEWYIPEDVLIQLTVLIMSSRLLETRREVK